MKILDKAYRGPFYVISVIITLALMVVNSDQVADLNLSWLPIVTQGLTVLAWVVQQYTTVGDTGGEE
jgi:hypothetical protein